MEVDEILEAPAQIFLALTRKRYDKLLSMKDELTIKTVLPCLCRMALCPATIGDLISDEERRELLTFILSFSRTNTLVTYMSIDFETLENDLRKELKTRKKNYFLSGINDSFRSTSGIAHRFECSDAVDKMRILFGELLTTQFLLKESKSQNSSSASSSSSQKQRLSISKFLRKFEPLDNMAYLDDCCDSLNVALAERPSLISVESLCETLICYRNGPQMIQSIILNIPDGWKRACYALIDTADSVNAGAADDTPIGRQRIEALALLSNLNLSGVMDLVNYCVETRKLFYLAISLALRFLPFDALCPLLAGNILGTDNRQRSALSSFIQAAQKTKSGSILSEILQNLKQTLREKLLTLTPSNKDDCMETAAVQHACQLVRLFCGLRCIGGIKFSDEDIKAIIDLICSKTDQSEAGLRFVCIGLSAILACPAGNAGPVATEIEAAVNSWLKSLILYETAVKGAMGKSYSEMLLLIAIHFNSNQLVLLSQLVSSVLGMKITLKGNQLSRLRMLFTQDLFNEQTVAERVAHIPVTKNLNVNISGYLPVHCVQQLMQTKMFFKHKVAIQDWIVRQLEQCTAPIHNAVPLLIEAYVSNCVPSSVRSTHHNASNVIASDPIEESVLLEHFAGDPFDESRLTTRILYLYYVLLYEDLLYAHFKNASSVERHITGYSQELFDRIPIKYLVAVVESRPADYGVLYPSLLKTSVSQFPYLFAVDECMDPFLGSPTSLAFPTDAVSLTVFASALNEADRSPAMAVMVLDQVLRLPGQIQSRYADSLCDALPTLLRSGVPHRVVQLAYKLWSYVEVLLPRQLYLRTVTALWIRESSSMKRRSVTHQELCDDPLTVLRCDDRVYRCAPVLSLLLRVLRCYLSASRTYLQRALLMAPPVTSPLITRRVASQAAINPQSMELERDDLLRSLVRAQESAAVQILLEACLPLRNEKEQKSNLTVLREIRCVICSFVHQMFISDPMLSKLVHFQTYPSELLPIAVAGIPSMHICLDFIPELLTQPHNAKRVFAIDLLSYLCEHYTIPKAFSVARLAINVLSTLLGVLTGQEIVKMFAGLLPALTRISCLFPPLSSDIAALLIQVGRICVGRLMVDDGNASVFLVDAKIDGQSNNSTTNGSQTSDQKFLTDLRNVFHNNFPESVLSCPF